MDCVGGDCLGLVSCRGFFFFEVSVLILES